MKLHLLFNHKLTPDQIADAKNTLKVDSIVYLPEKLQALWQNIPPSKTLDLKNHLEPIVDYFKNQNKNDFVLIQGDFGAVYYMVNKIKNLKLTPIYATTERKSIEEKLSDNTIITKRVFKHVCFRKYN